VGVLTASSCPVAQAPVETVAGVEAVLCGRLGVTSVGANTVGGGGTVADDRRGSERRRCSLWASCAVCRQTVTWERCSFIVGDGLRRRPLNGLWHMDLSALTSTSRRQADVAGPIKDNRVRCGFGAVNDAFTVAALLTEVEDLVPVLVEDLVPVLVEDLVPVLVAMVLAALRFLQSS